MCEHRHDPVLERLSPAKFPRFACSASLLSPSNPGNRRCALGLPGFCLCWKRHIIQCVSWARLLRIQSLSLILLSGVDSLSFLLLASTPRCGCGLLIHSFTSLISGLPPGFVCRSCPCEHPPTSLRVDTSSHAGEMYTGTYTPVSALAGLRAKGMFNLFRDYPTVFQSGRITLPSHQQRMKRHHVFYLPKYPQDVS